MKFDSDPSPQRKALLPLVGCSTTNATVSHVPQAASKSERVAEVKIIAMSVSALI